MRISRQHHEHFVSEPLPEAVRRRFAEAARKSLVEQRRLEESDELTFEAYLQEYFEHG